MTFCFDETGTAKDSPLGLYRRPPAENRLDLLVFRQRGRNENQTQHSGCKFAPVHNVESPSIFKNRFDLFPSNTLLEREPTGSSATLDKVLADNHAAVALRNPMVKRPKDKECPDNHWHKERLNQGFMRPVQHVVPCPTQTKREADYYKKHSDLLPPRKADRWRCKVVLANGRVHGLRTLNILNRPQQA